MEWAVLIVQSDDDDFGVSPRQGYYDLLTVPATAVMISHLIDCGHCVVSHLSRWRICTCAYFAVCMQL